MDEQSTPRLNEPIPNQNLLRILCILTFIGSGLGVFSYGIIGLLHDFFTNNLSLVPDEQNRDLIEMMLSAGKSFFFLNTLLYAISFFGALKLWKLEKIGFHLYTASQLALLIIPMLFIKGFPTNGISIFLTLLFVLGYSGFLKYMK